jgi:DNA-binding LacI/PurR family transcriptional regulator
VDPQPAGRLGHDSRGRRSAVSISDVARAAGVSPSTVSYVLSGKRPISEATRQRVDEAIQQLGYRPHAGARALASSRTNVLALIAPLRVDVVVPVIMQFVTSIVTTARDHDHDVLLLTHDEGPTGIERVASSAMVDALVVMDVEERDSRLPVLATLRQPVVLIGLPRDTAGLSCVDLDFRATGRLALAHLAQHGHRRVGLIGSPAAVYERGTSYATRLLDGGRAMAREHEVELVWRPCEPTYDGLAQCLDRLESELPDLTALVVHNEAVLGALFSVLQSSGRRVPDDLSILAVCPPDVALGQPVRLSSIDIPAHALGAIAVEMVLNQLSGRRDPETRLLAPKLTERDSCGSPPEVRGATPGLPTRDAG